MNQVISNFDGNRAEDWATPRSLMLWISNNLGWNPTLDAAASVRNTKAAHFYSKNDDGLTKPWYGNVWVNPPYGKAIPSWVEKAGKEITRKECKSIMMLLPARVDTKWFHELVVPHAWMVYFIKGRLNHQHKNQAKSSTAPFPSMLVYFRKHRLPETGMRALDIPKEARGCSR